MWFVMLFPSILVIFFFATLNWNHKVLYAPSDYKDEGNFIKLTKATPSEIKKKQKDEIEVAEEVRQELKLSPVSSSAAGDAKQVEELTLNFYKDRDPASFRMQVRLDTPTGRHVLDGAITSSDGSAIEGLEVKYLVQKSPDFILHFVKRVIDRFNYLDIKFPIRLILVIKDLSLEEGNAIHSRLHSENERSTRLKKMAERGLLRYSIFSFKEDTLELICED
jgi:hypothetical protein